jgi:FKBP-type peptidyl-prolyl cis-trans isomerase FkpA
MERTSEPGLRIPKSSRIPPPEAWSGISLLTIIVRHSISNFKSQITQYFVNLHPMQRLSIIYILILFFFPFFSKGQTGFSTSSSGLKYRFFTNETGTKPKKGDIIKFNFYLFTDKDSLLFPKRPPPLPQQALVSESSYKGDIEEAFKMMSKGDSAMFLVSADSFYSGQEMPVPRGSVLKVTIKMIDIVSPEAHALEMQKENDDEAASKKRLKAQEIKGLDKYIQMQVPEAIKTADGFYYVIEHKGTGAFPIDSQTIIIQYTEHLLDGTPIDGGHSKIISMILGRHEVIRGLEMGVRMLKKHSKAKLFIPSPLAYGDNGMGKVVPPYMPLVYDVEILEIK